MSSFPFSAHSIDVLSVERPPQALHQMLIARGYCVRAMLGHEIGDVLYVSRTARRAGEFLAARRFGSAQTAPCSTALVRWNARASNPPASAWFNLNVRIVKGR